MLGSRHQVFMRSTWHCGGAAIYCSSSSFYFVPTQNQKRSEVRSHNHVLYTPLVPYSHSCGIVLHCGCVCCTYIIEGG